MLCTMRGAHHPESDDFHSPARTLVTSSAPHSERINAIQHTLGHVQCPACEIRRYRMMSPLASLSFSDAAEEWLVQHRRYIAARTIADYQQYIKALSQFFKMQLSEIHIGHIREYQDWRGQGRGRHADQCRTVSFAADSQRSWTMERHIRSVPASPCSKDTLRKGTHSRAGDESLIRLVWQSRSGY
jgi:hypothetical protein